MKKRHHSSMTFVTTVVLERDVASAHNGKIQLNVKFATTVVLRHVSPVHVGKKVW